LEDLMKSLLLLALPLLLVSCDAKPEATTTTAPVEKSKDYVCGMMVPKASAIKYTHEGTDYYFCADHCRDTFKADPKKYIPH
jgi:YHS domain-containing protein